MNWTYNAYIFMLLFLYEAYSSKEENRLLRELFNDQHSVYERPVIDSNQKVEILLGFSLKKILRLDVRGETLSAMIFINLQWNDYHFKWNPMEYGGLDHINVNPESIWLPDILLYNSADSYSIISSGNLIIGYNGDIRWKTARIFKSSCPMRVSWFPFDDQQCRLDFGAWSYSWKAVTLSLTCKHVNNTCGNSSFSNLDYFITNEEFYIADNLAIKCFSVYDDENFESVRLFYKLQRRALYYIYNLLFPCLITNIMILLVFKLPPNAGEKITLGVNILLNLTVLLQMVSERVPQNSLSLPLMGIYFVISMILCSLSLVFTILVLSCHYTSEYERPPPPKVLIFVSNHLATLIRMKPYNFKSAGILKSYRRKGDLIPTSLDDEFEILSQNSNISEKISNTIRPLLEDQRNKKITFFPLMYQKRLSNLLSETREVTGKLRSIQEKNCVVNQWKYIAMVFDQFCLILFSLLTLIVTLAFMTSAPNLVSSFNMVDNLNNYTNYNASNPEYCMN